MVIHTFTQSLRLPRSAHEVFAWHEQPGTLAKLISPGDPVRVVEHQAGRQGPLGDGARVILRIGYWPLVIHWVAIHEGYEPGRQFIDVQVRGPFAFWRHTHTITGEGSDAALLTDHVEYALPLGKVGNAVAHRAVRVRIEKMFEWRHKVTADELAGLPPSSA